MEIQIPNPNFNYPESNSSSPHSREIECDPTVTTDDLPPPPPPPRVRLMCSYTGRIQPRQHDNSLCYVGGVTRLVSIDRSVPYSTLSAKLTSLYGSEDFIAKYQLPGEDLDSLISVTNDEDLENMLAEYDRLCKLSNSKHSVRLKMFLFAAVGKPPAAVKLPSPLPSPPAKVNVDYLFGLDVDPVVEKAQSDPEKGGEDIALNGNYEFFVPPVQEPEVTAPPPAFLPPPRFASFVGGDGNLYYAVPATAAPPPQGYFGNLQRIVAPQQPAYDSGLAQVSTGYNIPGSVAYDSAGRAVYYAGTGPTYQRVSSNVAIGVEGSKMLKPSQVS